MVEPPAIVWVAGESEQAAWVADRVLQLRETGIVLKSQAVLFRAAQHSAALELELARRDIPFVKYGGLRFLDSAHVKDVLAARLMTQMAGAVDPAAALLAFQATASDASGWRDFAELFTALRRSGSAWPDEIGAVERWYRPQLERLHDDAAPRAADVQALE